MPLEFSDTPLTDEKVAPSPTPEPKEPEAAPQEPAEAVEQTDAEPAPAEETDAPEVKAPGRAEALAKLTTDATNGEPEKAATPEPVAKTPADAPKEPTPEDVEAKADEALQTGMKENTRERFKSILKERGELKAKVKDLEPAATFGRNIAEVARLANFPPQNLKNWVDIGVEFHKGNPATIPILRQMLEAAEKAESAKNPPKERPQWLKDAVDKDFNMTQEAADKTWAEMQKTAPVPAPQQQPVQTQQPVQQNAEHPDTVQMSAGLADLQKAGQAKHQGQWAKVEALAMEKVKAQGRAHPLVILERTKAAIAAVESELSKPRPVSHQALGTGRAQNLTPAPKSGRAEALKKIASI